MKPILILSLLVLLFAGCITDSGDNADDLIGIWKSPGNTWTITFRSDGSYYSNQWPSGVYTTSGNTLKLRVPGTDSRKEQAWNHTYYQDSDFLTIIVTDVEYKNYYDYLRVKP